MKLYTRQHLVIAVIIGAFLTLAAAGSFFFLSHRKYYTENSIAKTNQAKNRYNSSLTEKSEQIIPGNSDSFILQTSRQPLRAFSTADSNSSYTQDELQNINVYENSNEAVVNINTQVLAINWFLEPVPQDSGSGSGSIIDTRGYVVTNVHVIADAYKIYISLADGTQYEARVVGNDEASDIAVLKFDPPQNIVLKTIPFGDSSKLKVGQKVIAIGNPFGLERTLTTGVVSGLGRPIQNSESTIIRNMIQTDTAINPGNSGGPLLDTQGRMIGINTMIYSTSGSSAGIGFAVPVDTARRVVSDLIQYGKVRRGIIDASLVQLNKSIAQYAKLAIDTGLLVSTIGTNGPASRGGLRAGTEAVRYGSRRNYTTIYLGGDIIVGIDGVKVSTLADYYSVLESKRPGDTVSVDVYRGGRITTLSIRLGEQE